MIRLASDGLNGDLSSLRLACDQRERLLDESHEKRPRKRPRNRNCSCPVGDRARKLQRLRADNLVLAHGRIGVILLLRQELDMVMREIGRATRGMDPDARSKSMYVSSLYEDADRVAVRLMRLEYTGFGLRPGRNKAKKSVAIPYHGIEQARKQAADQD